MIIAALQFTAALAGLGLAVGWLAVMAVICKDAFAPQPMLTSRIRCGPTQPAAPVLSIADRIQAQVQSRSAAPWRAAA